MLCDYHLHTKLSFDSNNDIDKVITSAINKGMKYLAITDHHDFDYENRTFEQNPEIYYDTLLEYKIKYKDKIELAIGIELGMEAYQKDRLIDFTSKRPFDFIIGSTHGVNGIDPFHEIYWEGLSEYDGISKYFNSILITLDVYDNFDVYGHIDYVVRYAQNKDSNYCYEKYSEVLDKILKKIIKMKKGIEINTGGIRSGLKSTNPSAEIIRKYREYGGEIITVGSDAHILTDIASNFEVAKKILLDAGFTHYTVFMNRKPIFLPL